MRQHHISNADLAFVVAVACYATGVRLEEYDGAKHVPSLSNLCVNTRGAVAYLLREHYPTLPWHRIAEAVGMAEGGAVAAKQRFERLEELRRRVDGCWLRATEVAA